MEDSSTIGKSLPAEGLTQPSSPAFEGALNGSASHAVVRTEESDRSALGKTPALQNIPQPLQLTSRPNVVRKKIRVGSVTQVRVILQNYYNPSKRDHYVSS